MTHSYIRLDKVNLLYSSVAYQERSLKSLLANVMKVSGRNRPIIHDVHALKNVSLEVHEGERVGLLGHNGAGKSTFLKMVAGLYPISSGAVTVDGAVRALFDLSLGFEPDATGRENILYRGLLLGQTPKQMRALENGIVEFADLGEFIDYPIKTYSAGMMVRLAFAISTAVGGDILLLDEVIGAGDAAFMERAKIRIQSLIAQSKILILASHDFAALTSICQRGVVFHHGEIVYDGEISSAVRAFQEINGLSVSE